jgi:hypothetical protein
VILLNISRMCWTIYCENMFHLIRTINQTKFLNNNEYHLELDIIYAQTEMP